VAPEFDVPLSVRKHLSASLRSWINVLGLKINSALDPSLRKYLDGPVPTLTNWGRCDRHQRVAILRKLNRYNETLDDDDVMPVFYSRPCRMKARCWTNLCPCLILRAIVAMDVGQTAEPVVSFPYYRRKVAACKTAMP
jgi:hypothetical protein